MRLLARFTRVSLLVSLLLSFSSLFAQEWSVKYPPSRQGDKLHVAAWDSSQIYLSTWFSGVYKTTVGQWDWESYSNGLPEHADTLDGPRSNLFYGKYDPVIELYSVTGNPGSLWAYCSGADYEYASIYRSENEGISWQPVNLPQEFYVIKKFHLNSSNPDSMLITGIHSGNQMGMYFSADGGANWELIHNNDSDTYCVEFVEDPDNPATLINGVSRSFDFGRSWDVIDPFGVTFSNLIVDPTDTDIQYGFFLNNTVYMMYLTTDSGVTSNFMSYAVWPDYNYVDRAGNLFWIHPIRDKLRRSSDFGSTYFHPLWEHPGTQFGLSNPASMVSVDSNSDSTLIVGGSGIVFSGDALESFEYVNNNLTLSMVEYIYAHPTDENIIYVGPYVTFDGGESWEMIEAPNHDCYYVNEGDPELIHMWRSNSLYTSSNFGLTREHSFETSEFPASAPIIKSALAPSIVYTGFNYINNYGSSINGGIEGSYHWDQLASFDSKLLDIECASVDYFVLDVYALTHTSLEISYDVGDHWTSYPFETPLNPHENHDLLSGLDDHDEFYILTPDTILYSDDEGQSWSNVELGFEMTYNNSLKSFVKGINFPEEVFIVVEGQGVVRWDFADEWEMISPPDEWRVTCFDQAADGKYLIGTMNGIWIFDPNNDVNTEIENPGSFTLHPVYPNPFNSTATVSFNLNREEKINLSIYNTLGQQVMTLLDEQRTAGVHKLTFNANHLSSGIYFINLKSESFNTTQKVVLLR